MVKVPFHELKIGDWISVDTYPDIDYTTSILGNIARVAPVIGQSVGIEGKNTFNAFLCWVRSHSLYQKKKAT